MRFASSEDGISLNKNSITVVDTPKSFDEGMAVFEEMKKKFGNPKIASGGIAGVFSRERNVVVKLPQLPDWQGQLIKKEISEMFTKGVSIENDAVVAGVGEAVHGAGRGEHVVAYVTFGTGLGGAKIVGGNPSHRTYGFEPGHHIVRDKSGDIPSCRCGGSGHWEAYVSGSSIRKKYGKKAKELSRKELEEVMDIIAIGLHNLHMIWSPGVFVLGGGVVNDDVFDISYIQEKLEDFNFMFPETPKIKKAELGDWSGLYGALSLLAKI